MSAALAEEIKKKEKAETTVKSLECKLNEMEQRLVETLQMKELKGEEVESLKEQLTQAEEEAALLSSQLRELQGPQKESECLSNDDLSAKGNSLFAEVDDRRQLMKQQLLVEKNKIVGLKRAYKAKCSQVFQLQAQLTDVTRKWKEDATNTISSQDNLIESLRCRVKELEAAQTVQSSANKNTSEREFLGRTNGEVLDYYKFIEIELERGREEIKQLKETLNQRSISKLLGDEVLYKMETELRRLRAENAHLARIASEQKEKTFERSEGV
ncbi:protein Spindly-B-like [Hetaerina americana]|uniref:protein Spindly-B-like n=1 Tax=Hetaerina americana TaxID=62018 RepID=UPI003A7F2937